MEVSIIADKSRADYMKARRESKKTFSVSVDKENKNTDKSENSEDFVQSVRVGWFGSQISDGEGFTKTTIYPNLRCSTARHAR